MPMNDPRLVFDAAPHTYHWDGRKMFSVSEVLRENALSGSDWFTEGSRARGTYVHDGIALFHENELDIASIVPEYRGYFDAYFRFYEQYQPDVEHQECFLCDPLRGYAGKGDIVLRPSGSPFRKLIDVKTGAVPPSVGLQTAAYAAPLCEVLGDPYIERACLRLGENGAFELIPLEDPTDWDHFEAALRLLHWRVQHGRYGS